MTEKEKAVKRGYLNNDFRLFHLKDRKGTQFEFHYHDFSKIIIFISGSVTYHIEGRAFRLKPWDILFLGSGEVHTAKVDSGSDYERIILWMNQQFIDSHSSEDCNLSSCFGAVSEGNNLLRLIPEYLGSLRRVISQLEDACSNKDFGSKLLQNSLFIQLLVQLNRLYLNPEASDNSVESVYDSSIGEVIAYINENIDEDLSVDILAAKCYLNRYYLMHRFKQQTGYTLQSYIMNKRVLKASMLLKKGEQSSEVCASCGFGDYSSFVRAFKKVFCVSPKQYQKNFLTQDKTFSDTQSSSRFD